MPHSDAEFAREAVLGQKVITLTATDRAIQLVFQDSSGTAFPFWSSRSRAEEVRKARPEYEQYALRKVYLSNFINWLPKLEADGTRIGLNLSLERFSALLECWHDWNSHLVGEHTIQAIVLKEILEHEIEAQR